MKTVKFVLSAFSVYAVMGLLFNWYFTSKGDAQIIAEEKIPIDPNSFFMIFGIALVSLVLFGFIVALSLAIRKISVPVAQIESLQSSVTENLNLAA